MEPLTKYQAAVLTFVTAYIEQHRYAPTLREISDGLGGTQAISTVHKHLKSLSEKGYILRRRHYRRGFTVAVTRNATPEILSAYAAGWEAAVEAGRNDRASAMLAARATWLEGRS
jgi:SOS-response transcriptional repressor LexA